MLFEPPIFYVNNQAAYMISPIMTPDEYIQFTDDFLKTLDKKRADVIKHGYNEEKTKLKLKEALSESKSEVIKNYKTKLDKKFVEKE